MVAIATCVHSFDLPTELHYVPPANMCEVCACVFLDVVVLIVVAGAG